MTARFGRNKRRAAREAVAVAELGIKRAHQTTDMYRRERDKAVAGLDHIAAELIRALGPETAILPLDRTEIHDMGPNLRRWPVTLPHLVNARISLGPGFARDAYRSSVDLVRIVAELHHDPRGMEAAISFRDVNETGEFPRSSVAVSIPAFRGRGIHRDEVRFLLRDIEERFVNAVFGPHANGKRVE